VDTILAVIRNKTVHERHSAEWCKYGVGATRIESMNEAVTLLSHGDKFIFIAISEDSIPLYLKLLPIVRDITDSPIFVFTSDYTISKKIRVLNAGADVYDLLSPFPEINVVAVLQFLKAHERWITNQHNQAPLLTDDDIILSQSRRKAFLHGRELELTPKEFDVLYLLMQKRGCMFSPMQIYQQVWKLHYDEGAKSVIWALMKRLRHKLHEDSMSRNYIRTMRDVGYSYDPE
jgi:DNA-binding response OmpR family regulator